MKWKIKANFSREQPQHQVRLPDYYIQKFPVTVGEYRQFIISGGYDHSAYWTSAGWVWRTSVDRSQPDFWHDRTWTGDDNLPVVGVCWYEAAAYCRWLSDFSGKETCLPSEAEWEKAARGTDGRLYPWGNEFDPQQCNSRDSHLNRTVPVDHYCPEGESPYGCADMAGNASEWTSSLFKPYPYNEHDGRNDEESAAERVVRGGSWIKPTHRARVAARGMNDPFFTDNDVGFRYVRAA